MTDELFPCRCGNKNLIPIQVCESVEKSDILYAEIKCWECRFFMQLPTYDEVVQAWNITHARPAPNTVELVREIEDIITNGIYHELPNHTKIRSLLVQCKSALTNLNEEK